jgi:type VI secretion system protein ImpB
LKDLKSNLLDNSSLRKELERILANKPELEELKKQLQSLAPITNPVDPEEKTLEVE